MNSLKPSPGPHVDDSKAPVFTNDFVTIEQSDDGNAAVTVGTGTGAVALVRRGDKILMVKETRYATGSVEWELPRGGALEGENPFDAAVRSAEAKSGVETNTEDFILLGTINPDPQILTTEVFLYVLNAPRSAKIRVSSDEAQWVDSLDLVAGCLDGSVQDSFTCAAVLRARLKGII